MSPMQRALRTATALVVVSVFFAACAGSEEAPASSDPVDAGPAETGKIVAQPGEAGPAVDSGGPAKVCVQGCTTDNECQSSCPAAPNGIYCCDVKSGICYAPAESTCPAPNSDDAGASY